MGQPDLNRLLVDNLRDVDQAAHYVEEELQREVADVIDNIVSAFLKKEKWHGESKFDSDGIWIAPKDWLQPGEQVGGNYKCQFTVDQSQEQTTDTDKFWLTQLLGLGTRTWGLRWGKIWERNTTSQMRNAWRRSVGQQSNLIAKLRATGFVYEERQGSFFFPILIKQNELAQAMGEESPEMALDPFSKALETCLSAKAEFDSLLAATAIGE